MKKIFLILILILLTACTTNNEFIPKNFIDKEEYFSNSIQDYTDYAKYIYKDNNEIKNNTNYDIVKKEDIGDTKYDKFDDYSVYFYDIDKNTLYYIHSNI